MTPQDKIERLRALRAAGHKVLMIGDGLNDTAALAQAHASISFGTAAEASQSAADLILQNDNLQPVVEAIQVARSARKRVLENFAFSAIYNVFAIPFAIAGFVTPLIAAIAMSASSLAVTLNALRLAKRSKSA
jgi:Cu2+-exporting ATPase